MEENRRGMHDREGSGIVYIKIVQDKFAKKAKPGEPGSVQRTLTADDYKGVVVTEIQRREFDGQLIDIQVNEQGKFGWEWKFYFDTTIPTHPMEISCISMSYTHDHAASILKRLPNIALEKDVELSIGEFPNKKDASKMDYVLFLKQEDENITSEWNKDNPLPAWIKGVSNGQTTWNKDDSFKVLREMSDSIPMIGLDNFRDNFKGPKADTPAAPVNAEPETTQEPPTDDAGF